MFCGTKFKETRFLRKMNLVLKGWALLLPLQFWPKCLLPRTCESVRFMDFITCHIVLKLFKFSLHRLGARILLLPVQECRNISGKFFSPSSQMSNYACIKSVPLVQGQMILKLFEDKRAFVYVVNRVIGIDACDLLCDQLLHSCDAHFAHRFGASLFKCPDQRIKEACHWYMACPISRV
jgi:hypothetical protein